MSENDRGSFDAHKPCSCVQCAVAFGDQADPEHDELIRLRAENAAMKATNVKRHHEITNLWNEIDGLKDERDSQATLAAGYKRERDALREDVARLQSNLETAHLMVKVERRGTWAVSDERDLAESIACGWAFDLGRGGSR